MQDIMQECRSIVAGLEQAMQGAGRISKLSMDL